MKQISITLKTGNPIDFVVDEAALPIVTKMLDNKEDVWTNIGFVSGDDIDSYVVNDYIQPDVGPSPALKGNGGNENI